MTDPDSTYENHPQWLIWHGSGRCGALHRDTGITLGASTPAALTEAMTSIDTLLAWNGAKQAPVTAS